MLQRDGGAIHAKGRGLRRAAKKKAPVTGALGVERCLDQAALSHIAVSNALLISGMFVPNAALALALLPAFGAGFSMTGAASAARSHDPFS